MRAGAVVAAVVVLVVGEGRLAALPGDPERPQELAVVDSILNGKLGLDPQPFLPDPPERLSPLLIKLAPAVGAEVEIVVQGEDRGGVFTDFAERSHGLVLSRRRRECRRLHDLFLENLRQRSRRLRSVDGLSNFGGMLLAGEVGIDAGLLLRAADEPEVVEGALVLHRGGDGPPDERERQEERDVGGKHRSISDVGHHMVNRGKPARDFPQPVIHGIPQGIQDAAQLIEFVWPSSVPRRRGLRDLVCISRGGQRDPGSRPLDSEGFWRTANGRPRECVTDRIPSPYPLLQQDDRQFIVGGPAGDDDFIEVARGRSVQKASHDSASVVGRLSESQDGERSWTIQAAVTTPAGHFEIFGQGRWHGTKERRQSRIGEQFPESIDAHMPLRDQESVGHGVEIGVHPSASVVGRHSGGDQRSQDHQSPDQGADPIHPGVAGGLMVGQNGGVETATVRAAGEQYALAGEEAVAVEGAQGTVVNEDVAVHVASDSTTPVPSEAPAPPRFLPSVWIGVDTDSRRLMKDLVDPGVLVRVVELGSHFKGAKNILGVIAGPRTLGLGWAWLLDGQFYVGAGLIVETANLFDEAKPLRVRPAVTLSLRRAEGE